MDLDKLILFFFFALVLNFFVIKNYKFFLLYQTTDKEFHKPQSFHTKGIPRIGGLLVFFYFFLFIIIFFEKNLFFFKITILSSIFFLIGFLSDIDSKISPNKRLYLMLISTFIIIYHFDIRVISTNFHAIDSLINNNKLFSVIFVCLCLVFISNGCNFIDGFNGLLTIHIIIIFSILYYINYSNGNIFFLKHLIFFLIVILISILFYNFPHAKIFLGDGGSYFLGILTSLIIIELSNANPLISPFFFASILFYIFFEVFFSFFRKIFFNLSPLKPDEKHLHMLFFIFIFSKVKNLNKANYLTGLLINVLYFFLIIPLLFNYKNMTFCKIYFFILINLYLISYFILREKTLELKYNKKHY